MYSTRYFQLHLATSILGVLLAFGGFSPALGQTDDAPEDETLLNGIQSSGGYGAPTVAVTSINGDAGVMVGGRGGWIINRQFVLGGGGHGLATRFRVPIDHPTLESALVEFGYGGVLLEYIGAPSELIHYGAELLIGGGDAALVENEYVDHDDHLEEVEFFVTEAGGRVELNVTSFFRLGLSGGYRLAAGDEFDRANLSADDFSGPYGQLSLRFGGF